MPEGYHHLTYEERCQIYALMQSGLSQAVIARQLGVHRSTIKRVLDRNTGARSYRLNRRRRRRRKNEKQPRVRHVR
jgi:IS30 family transposase